MFTGVSKVTGVHSLTGRYTEIAKKGELDFPDKEHIYIDNLVALGLLILGKGGIVEPGAYIKLEGSYVYIKLGRTFKGVFPKRNTPSVYVFKRNL